LHAFLPWLPCGEWQSLIQRFCSTSDLACAQKYLCKRAVLPRALSAFSPNAAHDALLLPPCAGERSCVFHRVRAPPYRDKFARSRLPPANCALRLQSFAEDSSARRPCRIKAQGGAVSNPSFFLMAAD